MSFKIRNHRIGKIFTVKGQIPRMVLQVDKNHRKHRIINIKMNI